MRKGLQLSAKRCGPLPENTNKQCDKLNKRYWAVGNNSKKIKMWKAKQNDDNIIGKKHTLRHTNKIKRNAWKESKTHNVTILMRKCVNNIYIIKHK